MNSLRHTKGTFKMDIQGTAAGDAAIVRKVSETVTTAKEPSKNLVSQPSKWLKRLFKGMAIMTALGLTSLAAAQSNLVMNGSSVYADLGKDLGVVFHVLPNLDVPVQYDQGLLLKEKP